MTHRIILASGNRHKVQELQQLFHEGGLEDVELVPMTEVVGAIEIDETGSTFEENAFIKAEAIHAITGLPVLADDSGLCVDILDGAPGVRSARFAGTGATDADNRAALRTALCDRGAASSPAQFVCVLWYIDSLRSFGVIGDSRGHIHAEERGEGGFGYDPMFVPTGSKRTYAEHSSQEKSDSSHRGVASRKLIQRLAQIRNDAPSLPADAELTLDDLCRASVAAVGADTLLLRTIAAKVSNAKQATRLYEAMLQTYLFAGFPTALEALSIISNAFTAAGISLPDGIEDYNVPEFTARGETLCREVYGHVYEKLMQRFESVSPSMRSWMITEGYGKTLSRAGLLVRERELCIVCMLAALEKPAQLYSHVRGAMNIGADSDDLAVCVNVVVEQCGKDKGLALRTIVQGLLGRDRT
ncbi:MAG: RdgB/HAM1 family non-canonical purine NTP pyrophosphatase [Candidatus Kapabacteria bacterium]|nr:RdgB/HAM1 family non-canonical purine NTP pyrophosphatase [Candidatus Kapabacteria bacterium]